MRVSLALCLLLLIGCRSAPQTFESKPLVLTSDFGVRDGSVSVVKAAIYAVEPRLVVSDLSHELPTGDVWQTAVRLAGVYARWPAGTVFVTMVESGEGPARRVIVLKLKTGHLFVGPDNGHTTFVADEAGVEGVRVLGEPRGMRRSDVLATVGARLASGQLRWSDAGTEPASPPRRLEHQRASAANGIIQGMIPALDPTNGDVLTNVPRALVQGTFAGAREIRVYVAHRGKKVFEGKLPVGGPPRVAAGQPYLRLDENAPLAVATSQGNFARLHQIGYGPEWTITLSKP